jgi:glutathione S-transferase
VRTSQVSYAPRECQTGRAGGYDQTAGHRIGFARTERNIMSDLIFHHYASSPFSEKVRLVFGYKNLDWKSVIIPVIMPKPDVIALTGGYRKTPILQVGADIYCDTALICKVVDRLHPQPPLFPATAEGVASILAQWADSALFWSAIPYTMQPKGIRSVFGDATPEALKAFSADRAAFTTGMRRATLADATAQLSIYLRWLEKQLEDGRGFLFGDAPSIADFSVVHSLWFIRRAPEVAGILSEHTKLDAWYSRMQAFGHGRHERLASPDAIAIAAKAKERAPAAFDESQGFVQDEPVTVSATDYGADPVSGLLAGISNEEVAVRRNDERAGAVIVHFPRIGFQVRKTKTQ